MTKSLGVVLFLLGALVLGLAINNFVAQFASADYVAAHAQDLGLTTSTTNLRFGMGGQLLVQILVAALLAVVGWFLYGSETEQYGYAIVFGVLLIASVVIRYSPVLPLALGRLSPGTAFFAAQVAITLPPGADVTPAYVTLPPNQASYRVVVADATRPEGKGAVLLDFHGDQNLMTSYARARWPVQVVGSLAGTRTIARENSQWLIPRVKVYRVAGAGG